MAAEPNWLMSPYGNHHSSSRQYNIYKLFLNVDYSFLLSKPSFPGTGLQSPGLRNESLLENQREKGVDPGREEKEEA